MFHIHSEDHVDKKVKNIFEADIELTKSDRAGVDTKNQNSKDNADVDVDSVLTKRKAISSRRHLWVTKEVPLELAVSASKLSQIVLTYDLRTGPNEVKGEKSLAVIKVITTNL